MYPKMSDGMCVCGGRGGGGTGLLSPHLPCPASPDFAAGNLDMKSPGNIVKGDEADEQMDKNSHQLGATRTPLTKYLYVTPSRCLPVM